MPKIPTYDRQVEPQSLPNTRAANVVDANAYGVGALTQVARTAEAVGNQTTKGLGQLGAVIAERAQKLQAEQDYSDVLNATQGWMREANTYLYDPEKGVLNTKGYDARGIGEKSLTDLETLGRKYGDKLKNARQQQMFQKYLGDHMNSTASELYRHEAKEHRVALEKDTSANINLLVDSAIRSGDPSKVQGIFGQIEGLIRTTWGGSGENTIKEQQQKYKTLYHSEKVKMIFQSDAGLAKDYLETNKNDMDPIMYNKLSEVVGEKVKDNTMLLEADAIAKAAGGDPAKAMELIANRKSVSAGWGGIKAAAEKQLGKPYELGADGKNKTDCGQYTLEVFQQNGVDLKSRDVSEQARILSEKGGFTTDSANLKPGDLVFYKNTYQPPEGHGFNNITHAAIYAGNGKIIHAGSSKGVTYASINDPGEIAGYGTPSGASSSDPLHQEKLRNKVFAIIQRDKMIKADAEYRLRENLENSLAGEIDPVKRQQMIQGSGMQPHDIAKMLKAEQSNRQSDITMLMKLKFLNDSGKLTPADVDAANGAGLLSGNDYRHWMLESVDSGTKRIKKEEEIRQKQIDVEIALRVEKEFAGKKNEEQALIKNTIYADLDERKVKGEARLTEARKLIEQEKKISGTVYTNFTGRRDQMNDLLAKYPEKKDVISWLAASVGGVKLGEFEPFIAGLDMKDAEVVQALRNMQKDGAQLTPRNFDYALDRVRAVKAWSRGERYAPVSPIVPEPSSPVIETTHTPDGDY